MPLTTNKELLTLARKGGYAVGAFNINNLEILQAIVSAGEAERSPAIIAVSEGAIQYAGMPYLISMVRTAAAQTSTPISLHLDHGKDLEVIRSCIDNGFTSVMIDGSEFEFEKNIEVTKKVVEMAKRKGVSVEAELGRLKGIEEKISVSEKEAFLTDPQAAEDFFKRTGVDALAIAIGTSHGAYKFKGEAKLDFERLKEIARKVSIPLVLHGASGVPSAVLERAERFGAKLPGAKGIPDEAIQKAISVGISKINIDTDLRLSFVGALREILTTKPDEFDPRKILGPGREAIKQTVQSKMKLFRSSGKAV
ncbi:MAG TPA: class II fructose-1,6-bisphosphate aldolase [Thermodesulfobacteriota bacterium]|jgi:fructose-bisphosphate aldolase class II|nr:class II fructose-1,6-bisphosphate aldolase [Thermodesulfobacteriota bacterium]